MSAGWRSRMLPQSIGRKPLGLTTPVWEMNMMPRPSRMPSGELMPGRPLAPPIPRWARMRRKWWPSVVLTAKGALPKNAAFADSRLDGKRSRRVEALARRHDHGDRALLPPLVRHRDHGDVGDARRLEQRRLEGQ